MMMEWLGSESGTDHVLPQADLLIQNTGLDFDTLDLGAMTVDDYFTTVDA